MWAALLFFAAATDLVPIQRVNPHIRMDIHYATTDNFTHQQLYPAPACSLHRSTAEKLSAVEQELEKQGLGLKVFDCYRPLSIQRKMWALVPDERYVADPAKGSRHNRGAAVDLTLVDREGRELSMPSPYDDFTEKAHRDYQGATPEALRNRALLERVMVQHGFVPMPTEWWHFDDADWEKFPVMDIPVAAEGRK